ncbi:alpha/beta hydrolase [Confluentibacter sediminis]|uniref:alpha/beta hydrolase n=1 Tax=Confluentibacter sediminis TaxID=2219045 RepID=UPI000DADE9A0|nr:alpha/beta hydrolase [Confluentibacter sediminis]
MKSTPLILIIFMLPILVKAQNSAYLEAKALAELANDSVIMNFIKNIDADNSCIKDANQKEMVKTLGKFIEDPFDENIHDFDLEKTLKIFNGLDINSCFDAMVDSKLNSFVSGINLNVEKNLDSELSTGKSLTTAIIDGTAQFLVERTKKELTLTFYDNLKEIIDKDYIITLNSNYNRATITINLQEVFPKTILLLKSQNSFDTPSLGQTWVSAFKLDISNMPENLLNKLLNSNFVNSELGQSVKMSLALFESIKKGDSAERIIELFATQYNDYNKYTLHKYIGTLNLLFKNLINEKGKLVSFDEIKNLQAIEMNYLVGIVFHKLKRNKIIPENYELSKLVAHTSLIPKTFILVNDFENLTKQAEQIFDENGKINIEAYFTFASSTLNLYSSSASFLQEVFKLNNSPLEFNTTKLIDVTATISGIYNSMASKDYGASLLTTVGLLDRFMETTTRNDEIRKHIVFYGNFLVDIINASKENSKVEVKDVLNTYTLPVSSYRIKRQFKSSWDISAYPGIYGGYEFSESNSFSFGITAPIGFSYSWKTDSSKDINTQTNSNTIFLSAIDIAAPFSYRFKNDSAEGLPENIKWNQIFAPGIYFIKGFKKSPFALSFGAQFAPLLRSIEEETNVFDEKNVFRVNVGLTVDIPLFNLKRNATNVKNENNSSLQTNQNVFYGEKSNYFEPTENTYRLFFDKEGRLYPETFIPDEDLKTNNASLKNYYSKNKPKLINLIRELDLDFDSFSESNFNTIQGCLIRNKLDLINKEIRQSTKVFVLIHGFRKPIEPMNGSSSSQEDNNYLKDSILKQFAPNADVKFIEVYWDGTFECCVGWNIKTNKRIFKLFENQAIKNAEEVGYSLRNILTEIKAEEINIISHSLGARVAATSLFNLKSSKTDRDMRDLKTPSQSKINICLIAPAISSEPFKGYYNRTSANEYFKKKDNYTLTILYNEDDFVLKKKFKNIFGPGALKYGNTSLGCNYNNEIEVFSKLFKEDFKNSKVQAIETNIGKTHLVKSYANSNSFEEFIKVLAND